MSATTESRVLEWLAAREGEMLAELEAMVNTDGGSYDKAGVDAVGAQVKAFFRRHGIEVEPLPQERFGDCIRAVLPGPEESASEGNARRNIVLMGHRDTVFPQGEPQR